MSAIIGDHNIVYILLPVHNRKATTEVFINCLTAQDFDNYHLVLVDDGSIDGTTKMVESKVDSTKLTILRGDGSLWWGGALQKGFEWLVSKKIDDNDAVMISNDDVEIDRSFLKNGISALNLEPNALVCARAYNRETKNLEDTGVYLDFKRLIFRPATDHEEVNCLPTRGIFLRWDVMEKIGGFRPKLLPHYLSDYEFTIRAKKMGYKLVTTKEVYIYPDFSNTGLHSLAPSTLANRAKMLFSYRYAGNPVHWTCFALIVSPPLWLPFNLVKIWLRAVIVLVWPGNKGSL